MKITVKDKIEVVVQAFKFLSNEYRHFPVCFQVNLKAAVDSNAVGLGAVKNCGNTTNFSFEKDVTYFACNYVVDATRLPPLVPNGRYKVDLFLSNLNEEIAIIAGYGEIYTPIPYPKNQIVITFKFESSSVDIWRRYAVVSSCMHIKTQNEEYYFAINNPIIAPIYVSCNVDLLSKFHQNGYKLKDFRAEVISFDEEHYYIFEMKTYKYNRTTPAVNATFRLKVNAHDKLEVRIQGYKFLSNEYRHFPVRFQTNLEKSADANIIGLANAYKCGNLTTFYFYKDVTYFICNFILDETHFPPLIPNGRYRVGVTFLYSNKEIALVYFYVEVYIPIEYPKKRPGPVVTPRGY